MNRKEEAERDTNENTTAESNIGTIVIDKIMRKIIGDQNKNEIKGQGLDLVRTRKNEEIGIENTIGKIEDMIIDYNLRR